MKTIVRKGSGKDYGTIDQNIQEVKQIFESAGIKNWGAAMSHQAKALEPVTDGMTIVAELDDDERLFFTLMDYLAFTRGEYGNVQFLELMTLKETFWGVLRVRYDFTDKGDLGIRVTDEGKVVLVEKPKVVGVGSVDIDMLMAMARMGRAVGRS